MKKRSSLGLQLILLLLTACAGAPRSTATPSLSPTAINTPADTATASQVPSTAVLGTPPALPAVFKTKLLNPLDPPHTYIQDTCQYLQDQWSSQNSPPGTVVMVIMFHTITNGGTTNPSYTSAADFQALMQALHNNGFQAVTIPQLTDFMEENAKIPPLGPAGRRRPTWRAIFSSILSALLGSIRLDGGERLDQPERL